MFPNRGSQQASAVLHGSSENPTLAVSWGRIFSRKQMPEKPSPVLSQPWSSRGQDSWSRTPGDLGSHLPVASSEWASAAEGDSALPCCSRKGHGWSWPTEPSAQGLAVESSPPATERQHPVQAALGVPGNSLAGVSPQVRSEERQRQRAAEAKAKTPGLCRGSGRHDPGLVFGYSAAAGA